MEPWEEALDVDDSDLHPPTLLRPCKQQRCSYQTNSITATATTATAAAACISQSQTLDSSPLPSQSVNSLPQNLTSASPAEPPPQTHTIPGPAGIVQAAKLRKGQEEHAMATQEYIRKVVEDPEEDEDFKRNPWLSAIEFLYADGMFDYASNAHLGEINKCQKNGKLDQILANLKFGLHFISNSSDPCMIAELFGCLDFSQDLTVLMVSVFSPSRSTHYLNITKRNLVKVFYKDGGSSQIQTFHGTIDATPHSGGIFPYSTSNNSTHLSSQDSARGTPTLGSVFSFEQGAEGIPNRMKRSKSMNNEQENINYSKTSNKGTNMQISRDEETLKEANAIETGGIFPYSTSNNNPTHLSSQDSVRGTPTLSSAFSLERGTEGITNRMKRSKMNNRQENINYSKTSNKATNMKVTRDKDTLKEADVIQKGENVGQLSEGSTNGFNEIKALLPDWTEEQLLELCLE
ncbi:hypothetical protein L1987_32740 [Smallanthus sonchifolius]|uniref:Uncharacterized protein n=1 Tax=Smallanthus sonchifolius TaxID=185202 RepID=A0ACB9HNE7_9ASTR|nr:hypothetical protein L1987_32740 [Smallanthus sonchifolius]